MYGYGYRYNSGLVIGAGGGAPFANTKSLLFDGLDDYVDCGVISTLQSATQYSLSAWFKTTNNTKNQGIIKWYASGSQWIEISYVGSLMYFIPVGLGAYGTNSTALSNNVWYNVTMVFNGALTGNANRLKAYLNGVELPLTYNGTVPSITTSMPNSTFRIGQRYIASDHFLGNIDEASVFDYALTSAEVLAIGGTIPTDLSLLATPPTNWYRNGDNDTYPTITDVGSAASNNGTMTNMTSGSIVSDVPL